MIRIVGTRGVMRCRGLIDLWSLTQTWGEDNDASAKGACTARHCRRNNYCNGKSSEQGSLAMRCMYKYNGK
jgi:hypothetical protein